VYIDSPRGFHLGTSGMYISCFNQINPSCYLLFLYHHAPLIFYSLQYIIFIYGLSFLKLIIYIYLYIYIVYKYIIICVQIYDMYATCSGQLCWRESDCSLPRKKYFGLID
jgi:hypothetical protein